MRKVLTVVAAALLASCASRQRTPPAGAPPSAAEQRAADRTTVVDPSRLDADQLRLLQRTLVDRGFAIDMTGTFDEPTQTALARFQRARGLPATGNLNGPTMDALGIDPRDLQPQVGTAGASPDGPRATGTGMGSGSMRGAPRGGTGTGPGTGGAGTGTGSPEGMSTSPRPR